MTLDRKGIIHRDWPRWGYFPPLLLCAVIGIVFINTAWLCDDAFISFRVSDNLVHGNGLRWNAADRVQAFTNPLWTLLIAAVYAVTREMYYTPLLLSLALSLLTACLAAFAAARDWRHGVTALALLLFSRAFLDYSSSGLENPLSHLLIVLFFVLGPASSPKRLFFLALAAGLTLFNRMDLVLLLAPSLAAQWLQCAWSGPHPAPRTGRGRAHGALLAGLSPFFLWEAFALVYYGFPLPNTAWAKLGVGLPRTAVLTQGLHYLMNSLRTDYITLPVIGLAVFLGLWARPARRAPAFGILLQLAYVVWAGGDFMSGRFLTAPFVAAVLILVQRAPFPGFWRHAVLLAVLAGAGLANSAHPLRGEPEQSEGLGSIAACTDTHGVADERRFYCGDTGLRRALRGLPVMRNEWIALGRELRQADPMYIQFGCVGFLGFFAGPQLHIIDPVALGDAFLARLPAMFEPRPRPGHMSRHVPEGYAAALSGKPDQLAPPALRAAFEELRLITRAKIWDAARWRAIGRVNWRGLAGPIDLDAFQFPQMTRISLAQTRSGNGPWTFSARGIEIQLDAPQALSSLSLLASPHRPCDILLMLDGSIVWRGTVEIGAGMQAVRLPGVRCSAVRIMPWPNMPWLPLTPVPAETVYTLRVFQCGP